MLRKLGKTHNGEALKILKAKLDEYNIPYFFIQKKEPPKLIPLSEILRENRYCCSKNLKKRLIKEGLKEDKCEICG